MGDVGFRLFPSISLIGNFLDLSGVAKITSLLVLPFAHEDLAIILGAYLVVNNLMSATVVGLALFGGIVASDLALYGIGYAARYVPWLNRFAVDSRVLRFGDALKRNVFGLVALCRVVPGIVFVAFIACGWSRVSFVRFALASIAVSAIYLPLMLYLVIMFGDALDESLGIWAWPILFAVIGATSFVRKRVFGFREAAEPADSSLVLPLSTYGMPPLTRADRKVAAAERIPQSLFYVPLALNWIWLGIRHGSLTLPTAANPKIFTGGMWGESKSSYFDDVATEQSRWIAAFIVFHREAGRGLAADVTEAKNALAQAGLDYPLVAKPDIGWHGHGVRRIDDAAALKDYIAQYPEGTPLILQRYVQQPAEAAVLYARLPNEPRGRILSLTFRYFPHVVGDGCSTVRQLIAADARAQWKSALHLGGDRTHRGIEANELARIPERGEVVRIALIGNQRAGALYRDGRRQITRALDERFDAIARSMTEFHYGRFDIRFESVEMLMQAENFSIVEINGIGGEAIDCWDPRLSIREVYRRLAEQQRLLFLIGERNRARGFLPTAVREFVGSLMRQGQLIRRYPAST